jgi:hypothetical protein
MSETTAASVCRCSEMTAVGATCDICRPPPAQALEVKLTLADLDGLLDPLRVELAKILREYAAQEEEPVRRRLQKIADAFEGIEEV